MYIMSVLLKNYKFSKNFVLKAENFVLSDEVTLASHFGNTRKYPLRGYILGVLTHTTAWDRI